MSKSPVRPSRILSTIILAAATISTAAAQTNGTWTNLTGGSWSSGLNWSGGAIADGVGAVADFSTLNITANATVTLDGDRTVGTVRFGDLTTASNDWFLEPGTGGNLILGTASGPAIFQVDNRSATINVPITGSTGFNVTGAGNLILGGTNTYTGKVTVAAGSTLTVKNSTSLGATGAGNETIIQSGGVLNLAVTTHNTSIGQDIIRISGTGINNGGAIVNTTSNWANVHQVVLDADSSIGGTLRWQFNGTGSLFDLNGFKLTKVGASQIAMTGGIVTDGDIDVNAGNLSFEAGVNVKGNGTITVASGAILGLWANTAGAQTRAVVLNGGAILRELGSNNATSTFSSPITARGDFTLDVIPGADVRTNLTLPGGMSEEGGSFGFRKTGNGKLTLNAPNNLTGTINLDAGATVLGALGTLNASTINLGSGATLDVSAAGGHTIGANRTLTAGRTGVAATDITGNLTVESGGTLNLGPGLTYRTLTLANSLTLNSATVNFDIGGVLTAGGDVNDLIAVGENLTLSGVSTVALRTTGASPAAGAYTLATYAGTLTGGAANISITVPAKTRQTFTPDTTSTPGSVLIQVGGDAGNLIWAGGQAGNAWDLDSTTNFRNGATADKFLNLDTVNFTDTGSNATPLNLSGELRPALVSVNASKDYEFAGFGKIRGDAVITKSGTGKLTISGETHDFSGGVVINEGVVSVAVINAAGVPGPLGTGAVTLAGGTLEYNGFGDVTSRELVLGEGGGKLSVFDMFSNLILETSPRGTTGFTKTGEGILTATYAATYTGGTTIAEGTFRLGNARALGNTAGQAVTILPGAALDANGITPPAGSPKIVVTMAGDGPDGRGAMQNYTTGVTNNNIASSITLSGDASIGTSTRYDFVGSSFNGGTFTLTKKGTGETWWAPSNAGATVGDIIVEAGRFGVQSTENLGSLAHSIIVNPGARVSSYNTVTNSKPIILDGGMLHNNSAGTVLGSVGTWNGTLTLDGPATTNKIDTMGGPITVNGKVTGVGGFEQLSTGTAAYRLDLSNDGNDWLGETQITRGTLGIVGSGKFSPASALIMNGAQATFDGGNTPQTIAGLSGTAGTITNVDLTVNQTEDGIFAGQITGANSILNKAGTGVLTLTGSNTYQGSTTVRGGILAVWGSISGSTSVSVVDSAVLRLTGESNAAAGRINNSAGVILGDATPTGVPKLELDTFVLERISEQVGALSLQSNGVIDFGLSELGGILRFADSSALSSSWNGTLQIWNWTGTTNGGGIDQLFFGSTLTTLTANQLSRITFFSDDGKASLGTARFLPGGGGEIVPIPEPSALHLAAAALGIGAWRRRRS